MPCSQPSTTYGASSQKWAQISSSPRFWKPEYLHVLAVSLAHQGGERRTGIQRSHQSQNRQCLYPMDRILCHMQLAPREATLFSNGTGCPGAKINPKHAHAWSAKVLSRPSLGVRTRLAGLGHERAFSEDQEGVFP